MDCQTARHILRVTNSQGFHMRPCATFAALASRYQSEIKVLETAGPLTARVCWI